MSGNIINQNNREKLVLENITIEKEEQLPKGCLISARGDTLEIPDLQKKEILIWKVGAAESQKDCWVLAISSAFGTLNFLQAAKIVNDGGFRVVKKAKIDPTLLKMLYAKKEAEIAQKENKEDSEIITYFERVLMDALKESVSDIHIENRPNVAQIKMRKHGEMLQYASDLTPNEINNLCSVVYNVLAENKDVAFDPTAYQQGAVNYTVNDMELKLRYQSLPVYPNGYDVVMRVLPIGKDESYTPLDKLGYTSQQVDELLDISSRPVGSLTIAGTTGSGKSTTLKNLIMFINEQAEYKIKIFTIEDPPEYKIPRVSQIPVVRRKDQDYSKVSPFEAPMTSCMRADPDIIMIGEVRDKVTGDLSKKAIQSGHQVLTTVHASSAIGIIERYIDFGMTRPVLGSPEFLNGLIYQKLLATVCPHCSMLLSDALKTEEGVRNHRGIAKRLGELANIDDYPIRLRGSGCEKCGGMGVKGRSVCAEIICVDMNMLALIKEGDTLALYKYWRTLSDGKIDSENMRGKTAMEHGVLKILQGIVDPYDVESSFKPLDELYKEIRDLGITTTTKEENLDQISNEIKQGIWSDL